MQKKILDALGGKYREIVLAVAFFLVFDLAVLVLNFYISYQIASDAVAINLAGRQRMLSQRMTKSLYGLDAAHREGHTRGEWLAELDISSRLFGGTLDAFMQGGTVTGGAGQAQWLAAAPSSAAQGILAEARELWLPLEREMRPLLVGGELDAGALAAAVARARASNLQLLKLMNDLTSELESLAQAKADRLRLVQTAGITLALLNFLFILFKFIRRLREGDRAVEAARQETDEILATVREGLFLLDRDFRVGSQFSRSLAQVLEREIAPGDSFVDYLRGVLEPVDFDAARDFMELLFNERVVEELMGDLNPLVRVPLRSRNGQFRYLHFEFKQVRMGGASPHATAHLLVTVEDVTEEVVLARELDAARERSKGEVAVLLDLLDVEPALLAGFLDNARAALDHINRSLQGVQRGGHRRLVDSLFRQVHALKGDAATLGLALFEQGFHEFEGALRTLREMSAPDGEDLLSLMPHLEAGFARVQQVETMLERLQRFQVQGGAAADGEAERRALEAQLGRLAERIAGEQGKQVEVNIALDLLHRLSAAQRQHLREIVVQCVRNALTHGLETPQERTLARKSPEGRLEIRLSEQEHGEFLLECRDDGRGIDPDRIRAALIDSGRYSAEALAQFSDQQVVMKLFEAGVSTAAEPGRDAGQGVGLDLISERVKQLGGRLRLASRRGAFTTLALRFSS